VFDGVYPKSVKADQKSTSSSMLVVSER